MAEPERSARPGPSKVRPWPASPFSGTAATPGRGSFVPSGVAWYRKHFTLPQSLASDRVYVEFDGVMANSDVYVNGTHLGHHPYGYASFRYDMTSSVQFGTADNVIAVKTDTTVQPAERFYAGAGIYRHVRVVAVNPVHVDQYATFVTTPTPTTTAATVHVTTTVVNSGSAAASVSVSGVVSDPSGTALAPVRTPAQTIAAAASASFTFDVPVASPRLWDLTTPNMYELVTSVDVGNTAVDDDITAFGIRELTFKGGLTLNGKPVWLQGAANHQDFHGLGMAPPQRAIQRRLAQLKALGVNALRTAHEPPSPDFLDLTDRMGFLVLDEFSDVWTAHKYTDVGDYAAFFNVAATTPTGLPAVPAVTGVTNANATWWQVDFTGWIMRDRNHPSVALYSVGNEIHDGIGARTPILTKMIAMSRALDPSRYDTQALLDPATSGDVSPGATNGLLDVWGDNYDVTTCISALANAPTKSGVLTEMTMSTSTWSTVLANPGFSGEFVWTGVDYLGESVTSTGDPVASYPTVGNAGNALMDALGTTNPNGYAWQPVWGVPRTTPPATGTTAAKVVLAADHPTLLTDGNDVSFVKATIADASGNVVTSATSPGDVRRDRSGHDSGGGQREHDGGNVPRQRARGLQRRRVRDRPGDGRRDDHRDGASGQPDQRLRDGDGIRRHVRAVRDLRDLQLKKQGSRSVAIEVAVEVEGPQAWRRPVARDRSLRARGQVFVSRRHGTDAHVETAAVGGEPGRVVLPGRIELGHVRGGAEGRRRARARGRPDVALALTARPRRGKEDGQSVARKDRIGVVHAGLIQLHDGGRSAVDRALDRRAVDVVVPRPVGSVIDLGSVGRDERLDVVLHGVEACDRGHLGKVRVGVGAHGGEEIVSACARVPPDGTEDERQPVGRRRRIELERTGRVHVVEQRDASERREPVGPGRDVQVRRSRSPRAGAPEKAGELVGEEAETAFGGRGLQFGDDHGRPERLGRVAGRRGVRSVGPRLRGAVGSRVRAGAGVWRGAGGVDAAARVRDEDPEELLDGPATGQEARDESDATTDRHSFAAHG